MDILFGLKALGHTCLGRSLSTEHWLASFRLKGRSNRRQITEAPTRHPENLPPANMRHVADAFIGEAHTIYMSLEGMLTERQSSQRHIRARRSIRHGARYCAARIRKGKRWIRFD